MATYTIGYLADGTACDYTTTAAFKAAAAVKDLGQVWYSNATMRRRWGTVFAASDAVPCSLTGMLANRGVVFDVPLAGTWLSYSGDLSAANALITIQNFTILGCNVITSTAGILWNDTSGTATGVRVTNVDVRGYYRPVRFSAGASGSCQVDRCFLNGSNDAIYTAVAGTKIYNNTFLGGVYGISFAVASGAGVIITNCFAHAGTTCYRKISGVDPVVTYCASTDATADDWGGAGNLINQYTVNMKFWGDNCAYPIEDFRILTTSPLYHAGTNLSLGTDCDGNTVDGSTPSIGWHEGTVNAFAVTWPSETQVRSGQNFTTFAGAKTATLTVPAVGNVRAVQYGAAGTEYTGDLSNLVATDAAYAALEAARNATDAAAGDIATGKYVKIADVTIDGAAVAEDNNPLLDLNVQDPDALPESTGAVQVGATALIEGSVRYPVATTETIKVDWVSGDGLTTTNLYTFTDVSFSAGVYKTLASMNGGVDLGWTPAATGRGYLVLYPDGGAYSANYGLNATDFPTETDVLDTAPDYQYGTRTGTATAGGGTPPAAPTWGATPITPASGQVTLSVGAAVGAVIYGRYKVMGATTWEAESETFKRTGTGTIVITGLTNGVAYIFSGYAKASSIESEWLGGREDTPRAATASTPEAALRTRLLADATFSALVGTRVYPQAAPQKCALPYAVYARVDSEINHKMVNASGLNFVRVQLEFYGATYDACHDLSEAARLALDGYRGTVVDANGASIACKIRRAADGDGFSEPIAGQEKGSHRVVQDYLVSHTEAVTSF